ncbi:venom acid phosphatase Acph-1, partial [Diachasma alloeum]|uniref:venom acid phosphatase Acph-1 n=1 Tax=Diachasma alloeum TaxID=454923 RepID=UPI0007381B3E
YPHGHGQLTNKGKQRVYELGIYIREQYGQFLGNIYYPKVVFARSTYYDRTKMSLQLVMAGIFPPALEQKWNLELNWQPVVVNYVPPGNDSLMLFYRFSKFKEEYDTVKRLPGVRKEIEKFSDFGKNLSEWTGASITDIEHFNFIYHSLASLHSMELDLPTWTSGIFPHGALLNATVLDYRLLNYNRKLRCLSGGDYRKIMNTDYVHFFQYLHSIIHVKSFRNSKLNFPHDFLYDHKEDCLLLLISGVILKKFIDNMLAVAKKDGDSEFKMELLGGHDLNIVSMLKILDVYQAHVPEYSSAIFVELLADNDRYFVNIHYYLGMPPIRTSIEIPGCGELWPLGTFVKLFNDSLPTAENIC